MSTTQRRCSLCGITGHNKNNKLYHMVNNNKSNDNAFIEDKYESCVMKVKAKQSDYCRENNYKAYLPDPTREGKRCFNPWAVCNKNVRK